MNVLLNKAIEEIRAAFPSLPYPGDVQLFGHPYQYTLDDEMVDFYRGKPWQDVQLTDINTHNGDPLGLPVEAFNYYLPALLLNSLICLVENPDDPDTFIDYLMCALDPSGSYPEFFSRE